MTGRLEPLLASRRPAKIFLTACGWGEGATTVARKLATAIAADGRQILLCAGETAIKSEPTGHGIGDRALTGAIEATSDSSLHVVDISDLQGPDVGVGAIAAFRDWLDALPSYFDTILVDVPPALLRQNWLSVMNVPDGIVLVVEAERTRSKVLRATLEALQDAGGHVLGIVFNKRRRRIPQLFYKLL